jgi:SPP1 gp7 family putative phage head morphogenesis protein
MQERGLLAPSYNWQDIWGAEHRQMFTVAKMLRLDLLQAVFEALTSATAEGKSMREFIDGLGPRLEAEGWTGLIDILDPKSGEARKVSIDTPARLELIYEVNTRQAYAVGRWERIVSQQRVNPYIVYRTAGDARVRLAHQAWNNVALPVNDGFWNTHFPPNGFRCRCTAYGIDDRGLDKLGVKPAPQAPPVNYGPWTNKRTGEVLQVPQGIDPGFGSNPGKRRQAELDKAYQDKLAALPPGLRGPLLQADQQPLELR